jgi:diguanylate cyclase (GGDEF)-like protein/PAS domain S-box-containing protein
MMLVFDRDFYKKLLDEMSDGVYFVDQDRKILYWNEGAFRLTGYTAEELLGRHCQDNILCHVDHIGTKLCLEGCPLSASLADGEAHRANVFLRHKEGRRVPISVRVQPIKAVDGSIAGAIEIFSDDSAKVEAQRRIEGMERLAFLDHLTGLSNRRFMKMSIRTALSEYKVHKAPFGMLMFDLDGFKAINDTFGHNCGDRALREVAKTLVGSLRPTDIVGRWGGDEFLAIVKDVTLETLKVLVERCVVMVSETAIPCDKGKPVCLSISAGAAMIRSGETVEALVHRADELMYRSKTGGRGRATTE